MKLFAREKDTRSQALFYLFSIAIISIIIVIIRDRAILGLMIVFILLLGFLSQTHRNYGKNIIDALKRGEINKKEYQEDYDVAVSDTEPLPVSIEEKDINYRIFRVSTLIEKTLRNRLKMEKTSLSQLVDAAQKSTLINNTEMKTLKDWIPIRNANAHGDFEKIKDTPELRQLTEQIFRLAKKISSQQTLIKTN